MEAAEHQSRLEDGTRINKLRTLVEGRYASEVGLYRLQTVRFAR
jgi:hypothetical protein